MISEKRCALNAIERDSIENLNPRDSIIYKSNMILFILVPVFVMSLPNLLLKAELLNTIFYNSAKFEGLCFWHL